MKRFLEILKTQGSQTTHQLAEQLDLSVEGARLQLVKMVEDGLVFSEKESVGVGRPQLKWQLTQKGHDSFPAKYEELSVQLLETMKGELDDTTLNHIFKSRENETLRKYALRIDQSAELQTKVSQLADIRNEEGYMAEWKTDNNAFLLIENHCPICTAAKVCPQFCSSELSVFQSLLGSAVSVSRTEHIIAGKRRCVYKIQA